MSEPLRVLIVEDEAIVLMYLEMLVEDAGHILVGTAASADEAIAKIEQAQPELVLLDMHLEGGSSGRDVARAVRDREDLTILFVTANALKLDDDMEGAAAVIPKPFSVKLFESTIAFLTECMRRPPPRQDPPQGLRLSSTYLAALQGRRSATGRPC